MYAFQIRRNYWEILSGATLPSGFYSPCACTFDRIGLLCSMLHSTWIHLKNYDVFWINAVWPFSQQSFAQIKTFSMRKFFNVFYDHERHMQSLKKMRKNENEKKLKKWKIFGIKRFLKNIWRNGLTFHRILCWWTSPVIHNKCFTSWTTKIVQIHFKLSHLVSS